MEKHRKDRVLVVGKNYAALLQAAKEYGFENIVTAEQVHALHPLLYPDIPHLPESVDLRHYESMHESFRAVMIMMDPLYWGRELQIIMDVLCSEGNIGTVGTEQTVRGHEIVSSAWNDHILRHRYLCITPVRIFNTLESMICLAMGQGHLELCWR